MQDWVLAIWKVAGEAEGIKIPQLFQEVKEKTSCISSYVFSRTYAVFVNCEDLKKEFSRPRSGVQARGAV